MSITISYDKESEILTGKVHGYLSIDDYKKSAAQILNSNEYPGSVKTIWDLSDMAFDNINLQFEEELIAVRERSNEQRGNAKIAIVSDYELGQPMVKLYKILSKSLKQNVESFSTIEEAKTWLLE